MVIERWEDFACIWPTVMAFDRLPAVFWTGDQDGGMGSLAAPPL